MSVAIDFCMVSESFFLILPRGGLDGVQAPNTIEILGACWKLQTQIFLIDMRRHVEFDPGDLASGYP